MRQKTTTTDKSTFCFYNKNVNSITSFSIYLQSCIILSILVSPHVEVGENPRRPVYNTMFTKTIFALPVYII